MSILKSDFKFDVGKILIGGSIFILLIFIIIIIIKKNYRKNKEEKEYNKSLQKKIIKDNLTLADSDYSDLADTFYKAVKGPGTTGNLVKKVFNSVNTDSDLYKVFEKFGTRDGMNFVEWFYDDISLKSNIDYLNGILEKKGIKYRF